MAAAASMFGVRLRSLVSKFVHRPLPATSASSTRPSAPASSPGRTAHHLFGDAFHGSPLKAIVVRSPHYAPQGLVTPSLRATLDNIVAESHTKLSAKNKTSEQPTHRSVLFGGMPAKLWMLVAGSPAVQSVCSCGPDMPNVALMALHKRNRELTQELSDLGDDFNYCVVFIERQKDMISKLKQQLKEATGHPVTSEGRIAAVGLGALLN